MVLTPLAHLRVSKVNFFSFYSAAPVTNLTSMRPRSTRPVVRPGPALPRFGCTIHPLTGEPPKSGIMSLSAMILLSVLVPPTEGATDSIHLSTT